MLKDKNIEVLGENEEPQDKKYSLRYKNVSGAIEVIAVGDEIKVLADSFNDSKEAQSFIYNYLLKHGDGYVDNTKYSQIRAIKPQEELVINLVQSNIDTSKETDISVFGNLFEFNTSLVDKEQEVFNKATSFILELREDGFSNEDIKNAVCDGDLLSKRDDITQEIAEEVYNILE